MRQQRIFISASYTEKLVAREYMRAVESLGYYVTRDWTRHEYACTDRELPPELAKRHANEDLTGVQACNIFWMLVPTPPATSKGAWLELGAALAIPHCRVIVSGDLRASIFLQLVDKGFETHDEALVWLKEVAGG
jgi:hypothetical protein